MRKIETDAHKVSLEELCKRFNSNIEEGLTKEQVVEGQKEHGPNQIRNQKNPAKTARVRRNDSTVEIPAEDLLVGDIVEMKAGIVPADIRIIKLDGFMVFTINIIIIIIITRPWLGLE